MLAALIIRQCKEQPPQTGSLHQAIPATNTPSNSDTPQQNTLGSRSFICAFVVLPLRFEGNAAAKFSTSCFVAFVVAWALGRRGLHVNRFARCCTWSLRSRSGFSFGSGSRIPLPIQLPLLNFCSAS